MLVFPGSSTQLAPQLKPNAIVFVEGRVAVRDDRPRLIAQQITPIEKGTSRLAKSVELMVHATGLERDMLEQLKELLGRFPGSIPTYVTVHVPKEPPMRLKLPEDFTVEPRPELLEALHQLLGDDGVTLRRQPLAARPASGSEWFRRRSMA